jgi:hypothetical protein
MKTRRKSPVDSIPSKSIGLESFLVTANAKKEMLFSSDIAPTIHGGIVFSAIRGSDSFARRKVSTFAPSLNNSNMSAADDKLCGG